MHWFSILLAELNDHLGQASIRVLDACLEVAGLPQEGAPSLSIPKDQVLARLATVEGKPLDATAFRKRLQKINKATKDEIPLPDGEPPFRVRSTKGRIIIELGAGAAFHAQQAQSRRLAIESTRADVSNLTPTPQAPYVDGHQVFISYGWENDEVTEVFDGFIDSLARKLQHPPIKFASLPPVALWVDKSRVHGRSESFDDQTLPACRGSDVAVFMLSNKWHASSSCRAEAAVFERDGQVERERVICIQLCDDPHDNPAPYDKTPTYPELWRPDVRTLLRVWALEDAADRDEFVGRIAKEILEALTQLPPTPPSPGGHETAERDAHDRDGHRRRELAGTHWHDEQVRRKNVQVPHASESDADDVIKIIPLLQDWVCTDESRNRVVALLGSFGAGKTTTAQALATRLVELDPNDSSTPLPVYLDMRRLIEVFDTDRKDPLPLAELITRSLHQDVRANLDAQSLLNMLRTQRSLVIVDGLDEVGTRVGVERAGALFRQLLEIVPGSAWTRDLRNDGADWAACPTRLMVTCRTHFFRNHVEELSTLRGQDRAHPAVNRRGTVKTYYMAPFSPDQVEGFLKSALSEADSDNALSKIRRNEQLAALVRRPIMTRFIAEVSQDLHEDVDRGAAINGARIYHHIFARALARDADKRPLLTTGDREQLLCALALELWQQRKPVMNADELERWFDAYAAKHQGITAIMRSEAWARGSLQTELRNASLLVRERGDGFAFVHTSFQEYFLAKAISDAMLSDRLGELGAMPDVSNETVGFLVEMNADQIERLAAATGSLWSPSQQVATRAFAMRVTKALMLAGHRACVPDDAELSALDLRDFWPVLAQQQRRFQGVNFSHSNLRDTNFSRAHFSGCVFEGTQLAGSRFQGCELLDCRGEPRGLLTARGTDLSLGPDSPLARLGIRVEAADVPHASGRRRLTAPGWHTSSVLNARLSPDGTQILTASYDGTARLWDARSGDELRRFEGHGSVVTSGVFSPDGTRILTASYDGTARLWDARSGDELCRFEGHGDWVCSGVSGPDGARILTASYDGTARLWDARSGDELRRFEGHGSVVTSGVFSPDGTRILTAS
ncbi:MAG: pentapeptide repeat-containing protein, partial [Pseudomonadota bacterium]